MGATNTTANYSLSQFIGTDKPAWLQDYNGDMLKIDTGINAAKVAADGAQNAASAAQNDATTANNAITNTINPAISSLNTTVGNQGGAINTINSLIGNGTPTTTDQTIIGAINEINAHVNDLPGFLDVDHATDLPANTTSYLATANCYVRFYLANSGLGECYVKINNYNVKSFRITAANESIRDIIPVKAGQTISVTGGESVVQVVIPFI